MPNAKSKKQIILEYSQTRGMDRVGAREIRVIEGELRRHLGTNTKTSPSYIANVLREAGARVEYNSRYLDPWMKEPYASRLNGLLRFHDFASAEASLQKLDAIYQEYRQISDRMGTSLVRSLVQKGKERAESLAVNPRVRLEKRWEKEEIARWFRVWLQISDLFFDWLQLRKHSPEFQALCAPADGQPKKETLAPPP